MQARHENKDSLFKKPGKLGATDRTTWIGVISRRHECDGTEAAGIVDAMISDGRLIIAED